MIDATIFLTVASGFHYAWVASKRIGNVTGPDTSTAGKPTAPDNRPLARFATRTELLKHLDRRHSGW